MPFKPGQSGNPAGKPKGAENKTSAEFKEAVNNLLNYAAPNMVAWLERIAEKDPDAALNRVEKLAEFVHGKISRIEQQQLNADGNPTDPVPFQVNVVRRDA